MTTSNGTATTGDSDYASTTQTVNFAAGETSKPAIVQVNGDTKFETTEAFDVKLSMPIGLSIADGTGVGTITNDDTLPTVAIDDVTKAEGDAGRDLVRVHGPAVQRFIDRSHCGGDRD